MNPGGPGALSALDAAAEGAERWHQRHAPKTQALLFSFKSPEKETGARPGRMSVTFRRAPCWCSGYFLRLDVVSLSPPFQGLTMRSGPRESVVRAVTGMNGVKVAT